jgi:hypothetical protein
MAVTNNGVVPLTLLPAATPSANIFQAKNGAGNVVTAINAAGSLKLAIQDYHLQTFNGNNDFTGVVQLNGATPSIATYNFATAWSNAPNCVVTNRTTQANPVKALATVNTLTVTGPNGAADFITYICVGFPL